MRRLLIKLGSNMRCAKCGFETREGMKFCGQCAAVLALAPQPAELIYEQSAAGDVEYIFKHADAGGRL